MADEEAQDGGQQHLKGALLRRAQQLHQQQADGRVHHRVGRCLAPDDALQVVQHIHLHTQKCLLIMLICGYLSPSYLPKQLRALSHQQGMQSHSIAASALHRTCRDERKQLCIQGPCLQLCRPRASEGVKDLLKEAGSFIL